MTFEIMDVTTGKELEEFLNRFKPLGREGIEVHEIEGTEIYGLSIYRDGEWLFKEDAKGVTVTDKVRSHVIHRILSGVILRGLDYFIHENSLRKNDV